MKFLFPFFIYSFCVTGQTWVQISDFPGLERDDGVAVEVNGKLYFGSGLTVGFAYSYDFYSLDPVNNSWSAIASLPSAAQRQYACTFPGQGSFYVFGGDGLGGSLNNLYKYTVSSDTWSTMTSKPGNGLIGASCLEFGDKIIIAGGKSTGNGSPINEVWEYTISSDTWAQKNNFPFGGRFRACSAVINNTGYLMFGLDNNNFFRKEMYSYNQSNDTWIKILDFPQPNGRAYAALKPIEGKLILFGGFDSLNTYHKDVWYFDPGMDTWSQKQDFPSFGRKGGMNAVNGNKFYYSCGISVTDTRLKETWVFDFPVGIKENQKVSQFLIYPNPATNLLNVDGGDSNGEKVYSFTDIYGEEIKKINTIEKKLYTGDLVPGVYILKIVSETTVPEITRFVKE